MLVIFKRLDGIFDEPETQLQHNLGLAEHAPDDEGVQPQVYLMAGDSSPIGRDKHTWPAERNGVLNAGFVIIHPSQEVLEHQLRVAAIEGRTVGLDLSPVVVQIFLG